MKTMKKIMIAMVGLSLLLAVLIPQKSLATKAAQRKVDFTKLPDYQLNPGETGCPSESYPTAVSFEDGRVVVAFIREEDTTKTDLNNGYFNLLGIKILDLNSQNPAERKAVYIKPQAIDAAMNMVNQIKLVRRNNELFLLVLVLNPFTSARGLYLFRSQDRGEIFLQVAVFSRNTISYLGVPGLWSADIAVHKDGTIFLTYMKIFGGGMPAQVILAKSANGINFSESDITFSMNTARPVKIALVREGILLFWTRVVSLAPNFVYTIESVLSKSGGVTFSPMETVVQSFVPLNSNLYGFQTSRGFIHTASLELFSIAYNVGVDTLFLVYQARTASTSDPAGRADVYAVSKTGNAPWTAPALINTDGRPEVNNFYPAVVAEDDLAVFGFLDGRAVDGMMAPMLAVAPFGNLKQVVNEPLSGISSVPISWSVPCDSGRSYVGGPAMLAIGNRKFMFIWQDFRDPSNANRGLAAKLYFKMFDLAEFF